MHNNTSNAFQVFNHRFTVGSLVDVRPRTRVSSKRDDIDPFFNDYHRYDEIIAKLEQFSKLYPSLTTYVPSIAVTYENRNVPIDFGERTVETMAIQTQFFGVDLNRNWDDGNWNDGNPPKFDDDGNLVVDTDYTSEVYEGPFPFSEPETNGTANFIASFPNRYAGIDFHSYGELILRSWGYTTDDSPNEAILKTLGDGIRDAIFEVHNETYTSEKASGLYLATGCADDWQSIRMGMVGFTIELRSVEYGFELPASEIIPTGEELWNGMLFYLDFLTKNPDIPPQLSDSVQPARPISIVNGNAEVNGAPGAAAVELSTQPVAVPTDGSASTAPIPFGTKISSARAWTGIVCGSLSILLLTL
ncbi:Zn-dependent exopeptidase [Rhizoclosmatium globosum]|uniref:Zn-dependent exopeptidase n=1 Tax=Rhizoclosmatium globosum TaxID=329046 RepID=A0A1Y2BAK8_9FUNG|nr:Zn-dependent exopeptidase [Rhizoclosmatium globosum]|eukprot:ORY31560.1 Zn-dependent exopeptidase [Rhizoclosmatium globosum]